MRLKKMSKGTLILAGLAAFVYYRYSKLSEAQKDDLISTLRDEGKKFYDLLIPASIKKLFTKHESTSYYDDFGEHSDYSF